MPSSLKDRNIALTLWLLEQDKNPSPKYAEYINILPKDVNEFPIMFSDEDLKLLEGSQNVLPEI